MIDLPKSWEGHLCDELEKDYMISLKNFLLDEAQNGKVIFPTVKDIFRAFRETSFDQVKVVIIGQDPYHGVGQAHGLCFSVQKGVKVPPSLVNIYKELYTDLALEIPKHGSLISWAKQGVLLLNSSLTVEESLAGSHRGKGWETLTDKVIELLNSKKEGLVFLLWGSPAQKKAAIVNDKRHLVLKAPHPSPLSSYRGFFGCKHFSQCNEYLKSKGEEPIDWRVES